MVEIEQGYPVATLSAAQIDTLRLVYAHKNSKEIARIMNVSSHTVDERIRTAMRKLGVDSRTKAAIIVAAHDEQLGYQSLIYQPSGVGPASQPEQTNRPHEEAPRSDPLWMRPPFPTRRRPYNTDSLGARLLWPLLIAIATIMAFAALYAVMLGLGAMLS
jgi:DNA-binding CsgD family transcriptional regulator